MSDRRSSIVSGPSQESIRARCRHPSGRFFEFGKEEEEGSIPARFEKQVEKYAERPAVKTGKHCLTYAALNQTANRLAHAILQIQGRANAPVALLFEQGASMIAALIGVLKAGRMYVPLDSSYPRTRTSFMIEDSQAELIITDAEQLALAKELAPNLQVLAIESLDSGLLAENPGLVIAPETHAYLLYTSGSTGKPKGVVENHRNVLHFTMNFTNPYRICAEDKILFPGSLCFSGSAEPLYISLLNGATLFPFDIKREGIDQLAAWLKKESITVYSGATLFRSLMEHVADDEEFPDVRLVLLGGDTVYTRDVELYQKHFAEDCILVNGLGSTEMKQFRRMYVSKETRIAGPHVPVGYGLDDIEVFLLDEDGKRVDCGEVGEIVVQTRYVAPCYWRHPELTRERFLLGPEGQRIYKAGDLGRMEPDGCLMHLGRKDFQLKIRGHRIEAGEIEAALLELNSVKEAVVVAREDEGDKQLVAYVTPKGPARPSVSTLRKGLAATLPDYMIPTAFGIVDSLPRTLSGKLDRASLPAPLRTRPNLDNSYVAPRNSAEEFLADLWAEILGLDEVGVEDPFLELGGHSLHAARIVARTLNAFQVQIPVRLLFEAPTVAAIADVLVRFRARQSVPAEIEPTAGRNAATAR